MSPLSTIAQVCYEYGDRIKKFFKPAAWDMHKDTVWELELHVAVAPDGRCINAITEWDLEYQWEEDGIEAEITNIPKCPDPKKSLRR